MAYLASINLIFDVTFNKNELVLELQDKTIHFEDYEGPIFIPGRFCILCMNSKNKPLALYLLDHDMVPFQIYGQIDIFNEKYTLTDESINYKKYYDYAKQLCIFAFSRLSIKEIEINKVFLLELESFIYKNILKNKFGWKKGKKIIIDYFNNQNFQQDIIIKIENSLKIAPIPKAAVNKAIKINLHDYYIN